MSKLIDKSLREFVDLLASGEPTPGGGSAAAMTGAQGAALVAMVCGLTAGRQKYAEHDGLARDTLAAALEVKDGLLEALDRDSEAYQGVVAVFSMPKDSGEEKLARKAAMQQALKASTLSPYEMMKLSAEGLRLARAVAGKCNVNAASDLGVAALSLRAALEGGWSNVLINLGGIEDEAFVREYREKGEALLEEGLTMAAVVADWVNGVTNV